MSTIKTLHVPYIPKLDNLDYDNIIHRLEENGERRTIEALNWATLFPYHPLTTFNIAHSGKYIYIDFLSDAIIFVLLIMKIILR